MKMYTGLVSAIALMIGATNVTQVNAAPVTVDFENYTGTAIVTPVYSNGYRFAPSAGQLGVMANGTGCSPVCAANGTQTLIMGGAVGGPFAAGPLQMTNQFGLNFFLLGFDYAEFFQGGSATSLLVTGHVLGGGTISQTFVLDGVNDGRGGVPDFQAASLNAAWASTRLSSVDFTGYFGSQQYGFQLDNVRTDITAPGNVPEPSVLVLLGLGVIGFAAARRQSA